MLAQETFKYGDLQITIEPLQKKRGYVEYGIRMTAPGYSNAFKIWHAGGSSKSTVAQVLVYDLISAYETPLKFQQQHSDPSYLPQDMRSDDVNREFIHAAFILKDYLHQAHLDVYKEWAFKPLLSDDPISRDPHEWMPRK